MRIVICDKHPVFGDALAYLLRRRGDEVLAVTTNLLRAVAMAESLRPDLCLVDAPVDSEAEVPMLAVLRQMVNLTAVVLLVSTVDPEFQRRVGRIGVRGLVDKHLSGSAIIQLLQRANAGETVFPLAGSSANPLAPTRMRNESRRLAAFLTPREREVLCALVRGNGTSEVARSMGISTTTARCHIQSLLTKMGAHSRLEVVTDAVQSGMVDPRTGGWISA